MVRAVHASPMCDSTQWGNQHAVPIVQRFGKTESPAKPDIWTLHASLLSHDTCVLLAVDWSKIPGHPTQERPRVSRHEVNVGDTGRLGSLSRFKGKNGLFPLRIEQVSNEEERF